MTVRDAWDPRRTMTVEPSPYGVKLRMALEDTVLLEYFLPAGDAPAVAEALCKGSQPA